VRPDLPQEEATLRAIAELCARLDGLPLAIELAAARANALSPREIVERLGPRLDMLQAGPADFPERHRSLRAAMTWSYELLSPQERSLFRRLAVFTGGATLAAIEVVCGEQQTGVLDALAGLIDKSLVYRQDSTSETRFSMLDTVREYALERLRDAGEEEMAVAARTRYFLPLAEQAVPALRGPDQIRWLDRLTADHDNLRAVLRDAIARLDAEVALRLASSLWQFWVTRGHIGEGLEWLEAALALVGGSMAFRAQALYAAGNLAYLRSRHARATQIHEAAMQAHEALGDGAGVARSMTSLGLIANAQGDYPTARRWLEKGLALYRESGHEAGVGSCLHNLAVVALVQEQSELARQELEESLAIWQRVGNVANEAAALLELGRLHLYFGDLERADELVHRSLAIHEQINAPDRIAYCLNVLGTLAYHQGDLDRAGAALERSLALSRDTGNLENAAYALQRLALVALERGDEEDARRFLVEALSTFREAGEPDGVRTTLLVFAALLATAHPERSARLLGTVDAMGERLGASLLRVLQRVRDRVATGLVGRLGEKAFGRSLAAGRSLSADDAIRLALDEEPAPESWTAQIIAPAGARVRLLSRFQVEREGYAISDSAWGRPQAVALLQYLLLQRNRAVPVDELVEAFWPEAPSVEKDGALYSPLAVTPRIAADRWYATA
jgi:predicted ATPase